MAMPYFDKTSAEDFGKLKLVGTDDCGNEIYSLGTQDNNLGNYWKIWLAYKAYLISMYL